MSKGGQTGSQNVNQYAMQPQQAFDQYMQANKVRPPAMQQAMQQQAASPWGNYGFDQTLTNYLNNQQNLSTMDAAPSWNYDPTTQMFTGYTRGAGNTSLSLADMQQRAASYVGSPVANVGGVKQPIQPMQQVASPPASPYGQFNAFAGLTIPPLPQSFGTSQAVQPSQPSVGSMGYNPNYSGFNPISGPAIPPLPPLPPLPVTQRESAGASGVTFYDLPGFPAPRSGRTMPQPLNVWGNYGFDKPLTDYLNIQSTLAARDAAPSWKYDPVTQTFTGMSRGGNTTTLSLADMQQRAASLGFGAIPNSMTATGGNDLSDIIRQILRQPLFSSQALPAEPALGRRPISLRDLSLLGRGNR